MTTVTADIQVLDRRVLLAERDAARRERTLKALQAEHAKVKLELTHAELEAAEYLLQIGRLEERLALLYASPSWRWSAPLRWIIVRTQRLHAAMGGPPPAVMPGPAPPAELVEPPRVTLSLRERAILRRLQRQG